MSTTSQKLVGLLGSSAWRRRRICCCCCCSSTASSLVLYLFLPLRGAQGRTGSHTGHQGWAGHCRTPPRPLAGWGVLTPGHLASPGPRGRAELLSSPSQSPRTLPWGGCHTAWPGGAWAASVSQYLASFSLGVHRGRERGVAVSVVVTKCVVCIPSL